MTLTNNQQNAQKDRIHIAHLQLLPLLTGVQKVSLEELKRLDRDLFEPFIICKEAGPLSEAAERENIRCFFVPDLVREISPNHDFLAFRALLKLFKDNAFDIVHTHSSKTGILGRIAGRLARVPLVMHTVHGYSFPAADSALKKWLYLSVEWLGARSCDAMVFLQNADLELALRCLSFSKERALLVPNGIDTALYRPCEQTYCDEVRQKRLGIDYGSVTIGMVGRLWLQKNPHCFLAAAEQVLKVYPDTHFCLLGDGELKPSLEAFVKKRAMEDNVHFLGWCTDVEKILPCFDIFVLTSLWEGMPLAILEAMSCGLPCVVSDIPGNRDLVTEGKDGLLFAENDSAALAKGLCELIKDPELRAKQGDEARTKVLQEYDIRRRVEIMAQTYRDLLCR